MYQLHNPDTRLHTFRGIGIGSTEQELSDAMAETFSVIISTTYYNTKFENENLMARVEANFPVGYHTYSVIYATVFFDGVYMTSWESGDYSKMMDIKLDDYLLKKKKAEHLAVYNMYFNIKDGVVDDIRIRYNFGTIPY